MIHRLLVSYRGTAYAGWQRQANALAIQQLLEEAVRRVVGAPVTLHGASRTDAGVHARGQVAHVDLRRAVAPGALVHGVNRLLPEDIRVLAADQVGDGFHARYAAVAKEYRYRIHRAAVVSPLEGPFVHCVPVPLDLAAMVAAARQLVGEHDFSAFSLAGGSHLSGVRRIDRVEWLERGPEIEFHVVGGGFLRGMVRRIVGTLLEVGAGRREAAELGALLRPHAGLLAGPTSPARGLVLERVDYDPIRWPPLEPETRGPRGPRARRA